MREPFAGSVIRHLLQIRAPDPDTVRRGQVLNSLLLVTRLIVSLILVLQVIDRCIPEAS